MHTSPTTTKRVEFGIQRTPNGVIVRFFVAYSYKVVPEVFAMLKKFCGRAFRPSVANREHSTARGSQSSKFLEHQTQLAFTYSRGATTYAHASAVNVSDMNFVGHIAELDNKESRTLMKLCALHPLLGEDLFSRPANKSDTVLQNQLRTINQRSRAALDEFVRQSREAGVKLNFVHTDLLIRRESKSQITLLIDMHGCAISPRMDAFYLSPVDSVVCRSSLRRVLEFQDSLVLHNPAASIMADQPLIITCNACGSRQSVDVSSALDRIACSDAACCATARMLGTRDNGMHPGGNREYFGPIVPSLSNVWVGRVDRFVHKQSRAGLITATVFKIFSDSKKSVKPKLPVPDPRVQWTLLPLPTLQKSSGRSKD